MPSVSSNAGTWILQWLELKSIAMQADVTSVGKKPLTICRHEMRHSPAFPSMAVQP